MEELDLGLSFQRLGTCGRQRTIHVCWTWARAQLRIFFSRCGAILSKGHWPIFIKIKNREYSKLAARDVPANSYRSSSWR